MSSNDRHSLPLDELANLDSHAIIHLSLFGGDLNSSTAADVIRTGWVGKSSSRLAHLAIQWIDSPRIAFRQLQHRAALFY